MAQANAMGHGGRAVPDRNDHWEVDPTEGDVEAGVFWPVLRNVGLLVAMALAVAWIVSLFSGNAGFDQPADIQPERQFLATGSPPQPGSQPGGRALLIPAGANGHFLVDAMANGGKVRFLIDTGASGILLTQEDAQKAGIHPASLSYGERVQTANGDILVARANLRHIRIAGLRVDNMDVWVTRAPMPISLLGMTFLSRLSSFEARPGGLILRW
jgi:aspartyl protease family protein